MISKTRLENDMQCHINLFCFKNSKMKFYKCSITHLTGQILTQIVLTSILRGYINSSNFLRCMK